MRSLMSRGFSTIMKWPVGRVQHVKDAGKADEHADVHTELNDVCFREMVVEGHEIGIGDGGVVRRHLPGEGDGHSLPFGEQGRSVGVGQRRHQFLGDALGRGVAALYVVRKLCETPPSRPSPVRGSDRVDDAPSD